MPDLERLDAPVTALLEQVGREVLLAAWERARATAREKAPGEWLTDADLAAEDALTSALRRLTPDIPVVGEERAAREPELLRGLAAHPWVWLVDPLDGTGHFARGEPTFGVMVALLAEGRTQAAWIHLPVAGRTAAGLRGRGVRLDGAAVRMAAPDAASPLRGVALTRFFPEPMKARAEADARLRSTDVHKCAAQRSIELLEGSEHVAAYWRTLPWDHAPGCFLIQEAGGLACRFDGSAFEAGAWEAEGLLVASDAATWLDVRAALAPDQDGSPKVSS